MLLWLSTPNFPWSPRIVFELRQQYWVIERVKVWLATTQENGTRYLFLMRRLLWKLVELFSSRWHVSFASSTFSQPLCPDTDFLHYLAFAVTRPVSGLIWSNTMASEVCSSLLLGVLIPPADNCGSESKRIWHGHNQLGKHNESGRPSLRVSIKW